MVEIWKDVAGFEGLYEVSNLGRVKSIPREKTKGGLLKQYVDRYGYMKIVLLKTEIRIISQFIDWLRLLLFLILKERKRLTILIVIQKTILFQTLDGVPIKKIFTIRMNLEGKDAIQNHLLQFHLKGRRSSLNHKEKRQESLEYAKAA